MNNQNLKQLLKEYEIKRNNAIFLSDQRKKEISNLFPELKDIDNKISSLSISMSKSIINASSNKTLDEFETELQDLKSMKIKILNKNNISVNDLEPNFECNICKDTGFTIQNGSSIMCNCLKQKLIDLAYLQSNISNAITDTFENFNLSLYSNEENKELYGTSISPRKNMDFIKNLSLNFIKNFDNPKSKNLLFTGNTGLGKTFLSNCIANQLIKDGKTVLYQTSPLLFDMLIDYKFGKDNVSQEAYQNIFNVDLLVIDDLGTESLNSLKHSEIFTILNTRLLNQNKITKTIISTNLSLNELYKLYDERILSRIVGGYDICKFFGEDIRLKK